MAKKKQKIMPKHKDVRVRVLIVYHNCKKQKCESQLQISMSNLVTNLKFTCVTKLIEIKYQRAN